MGGAWGMVIKGDGMWITTCVDWHVWFQWIGIVLVCSGIGDIVHSCIHDSCRCSLWPYVLLARQGQPSTRLGTGFAWLDLQGSGLGTGGNTMRLGDGGWNFVVVQHMLTCAHVFICISCGCGHWWDRDSHWHALCNMTYLSRQQTPNTRIETKTQQQPWSTRQTPRTRHSTCTRTNASKSQTLTWLHQTARTSTRPPRHTTERREEWRDKDKAARPSTSLFFLTCVPFPCRACSPLVTEHSLSQTNTYTRQTHIQG